MMRHFGFLLLIALIAPFVNAAQVVKVKGSSALLNMQGESAAPGDSFYAVEGGKKKALIKIAKIKGDKAIAKIVKGTAKEGMSLIPAAAGGSKSASRGGGSGSSNRAGDSGSHPSGRSYWGGMVGYAMDSMSVNINRYSDGVSIGTAALTGSGFSAKALFDYELFTQIWFRGLFGVEMFNVAGETRCGVNNAEVCDAKIMYASGDFIGRYVFSTGSFRPWLGFGIGLLFPASKSASALASSSIGTTNVMLPEAGVDFFLSPTTYIPISVEYGMLPKSDEVDAHWIAVRVGMAVPF